jgi:hypothetical protein
MAMSNAERQKRYRERRKLKGFKETHEWITVGGGFAKSNDRMWPMITRPQLEGIISRAVEVFGDDEIYVKAVYAEIAAYTEKAVARFVKYQKEEQKQIEEYQEKMKSKNKKTENQ